MKQVPSMLVGLYIKKAGFELYYYDEKTGDIPQEVLDDPQFILLAHNPGITYGDC